MSLDNFVDDLSSENPVPGGGAASALYGVVGTALTSMVCCLTIGKKTYAEYEDFVIEKKIEILKLQNNLKDLVEEDKNVYLCLNSAYKMPKNNYKEERLRANTIQQAIRPAAEVPLKIMKLSADALEITDSLIGKTSKMAVSDLGCSAAGLKCAILSAWLNVKINLSCSKESMLDIEKEAKSILNKYLTLSDEIYSKVSKLI